MKPKVFIATPIPIEVERYIGEHCQYFKWEGKHPISREDLLKALAENSDIEGLMLKYHKIDRELLDLVPNLKVISNDAVGYDNFDIELMKEKGIIGTNTPSVLDETVADTTFALMLAASRRIVELDRYVKDGHWVKGPEERFYGYDVHGAVLGIIGMGRIGEAVARRGKLGFNMSVVYNNRSQKPDVEARLGVEYRPLDQLLKESDFVVLLTPLTPETKYLMGEREFSLMKETAVFVNVSRGKTVNEKALIKALQEGKIYAAGLDVFEQEPVDPNNPLLKMKNVVTVPHIGSATAKTHHAMAALAAKNLVIACTGGEPPNLVKEFTLPSI
ncbi:2-hydroxyacid dehydrogenase [Desulfitibacter alkalitolerans]|uniref:2-hydroxyacid dehydrogenase n=1 Tax=Desulfitibacter alkalitolerans TaxID=264641 RepID=UPI000485F2D7|nr:D-glycerate dehydrogenase [Desulfitibacter alkalitolerans]